MKHAASIFNDVLGPVMRGPSSSHTAAALRIGHMVRQMVSGRLLEVHVLFDRRGSLATTYHGQGSDFGFAGGLLGYEPSDDRIIHALEHARTQGLVITFDTADYGAVHPNTYRISATNDRGEEFLISALSTGGGMIELESINGIPVTIMGDFYETLVFFGSVDEESLAHFAMQAEQIVPSHEWINYSVNGHQGLIDIKTSSKLDDHIIRELTAMKSGVGIRQLDAWLPVLSHKNMQLSFENLTQMMADESSKNMPLWELAVQYECGRGCLSSDEVFSRVSDLAQVMKCAIDTGLSGTVYEDRILGPQSMLIEKAAKEHKLIASDMINTVIAYITAIMEVKSSMGVIVAAPTAGSCACLAGSILGVATMMEKSPDDIHKALLAAGLVGVFIAETTGFAAELGGCQLECGAGSGMAAAGLVQLMGGSMQQGLDAAAMALQNTMGLICDPVADRVEVPCLGKNILGSVNAIACANMVLSGFDKVVPLGEVLLSMHGVAQMMPAALRCTGKGGLSVTETSRQIQERLNKP